MTTRGVFGPESVVDPTVMFSALAPCCAVPGETWTDIVQVERT